MTGDLDARAARVRAVAEQHRRERGALLPVLHARRTCSGTPAVAAGGRVPGRVDTDRFDAVLGDLR